MSYKSDYMFKSGNFHAYRDLFIKPKINTNFDLLHMLYFTSNKDNDDDEYEARIVFLAIELKNERNQIYFKVNDHWISKMELLFFNML